MQTFLCNVTFSQNRYLKRYVRRPPNTAPTYNRTHLTIVIVQEGPLQATDGNKKKKAFAQNCH